MGRKVKIVISDLHVAKGLRLPDGRRNILEDFFEDAAVVEFLKFYSTGEYADASVEVISNGDFFNMLQVDYQDQFVDMITEKVSMHKMERIFEGHGALMDAMRDFCARPRHNLVFVVGNHDAALLWPGVQQQLRQRISKSLRFYPDFYAFDGVLVTHGHRYEFIHHFNPHAFWYETPDGERYMRLPWGSHFVIDFLNRMKGQRPFIDKIKPFRKYLRYAFLNDFMFFWKMIYHIVRFWTRNRFHSDPFRRREFKLSPTRMANAMTHESMLQGAERILRNTNYRIVIMGHSHAYDFRQFGNHGEYFNTGTWTETISLDIQTLGRSLDRTYVLIEYDDQDVPQARLKRWNGMHQVEEDLRV